MTDEMDDLDWRGRKAGVIPTPDEFVPFAQELHAESDRGMALSGTAYLDDRLGQLIETYLTSNTNPQKLLWDASSPLSTFSARILLAHALGLINDKERDQLNMLRKVRNLFAHDFRQKMDDRVVVDTMANFREIKDLRDVEGQRFPDIVFAETVRDRFFLAVMRLAHQLDVRKWVIEDEALRLQPVDWRDHYF